MNTKVLLTFILTGVVLFSCKSNQTSLLDTISEKDLKVLNKTEYHLMNYSLTGEENELQKAGQLLSQLNNKETANKEFAARLLMLETEWRIKTSTVPLKTEVEEAAREAHKSNPREERIAVVLSLLEKDSAKRREILIKQSEEPRASRIFYELGQLDYNDGRYAEAVQWFERTEEALPVLFHPLFQNQMDTALRLMGKDMDTETAEILLKESLTLNDVISLLGDSTPLLNSVLAPKNRNKPLVELQGSGYIHDKKLSPDSNIPRKETAGLIASLLAHYKKDPSLLSEAGQYYIESGFGSPVNDVETDDWFFYAVILLLELEIMDLPDGLNFYPDLFLKGSDFQDILKALKEHL